MAYRPLITVGNTPLPDPSTYNGLTADFVDSARNLEAQFIGSMVRYDTAKIDATWKFLSLQDWAAILKLFKQSTNGKFINSVTFLDQTVGGYATRTMYVSDRTTGGVWWRDAKTQEIQGWTECRLALVEV